jgi:pimeloyl-ACP methyl ester carboxylesterase
MNLQILEFGGPTGIPVVFHFGTPQRGDAGAEFGALAASLNIRLICPTRPWYDDAACSIAFDEVTAPTLRYLRDHGIARAHAVGGSGGGPFALHLAQADPHTVVDATLFASMGHPDSFARLVSSPPTVQLLSVFAARDHAQWMEACAAWGLPPDLAHGAWGDFVVFFDQTASLLRQHTHPVHAFQSLDDENAPIESVRELLALATDVRWTIDARFGHLAIAESEGVDQIRDILSAIASRAVA